MRISGDDLRRWAPRAVLASAVVYAFLCGFHTVAEPDAGWQMAIGRQMLTTHEIPRADALSYASPGAAFAYPPFSGAILYLLFSLGGWAALSWLTALASAFVAWLLGRGGWLRATLSLLSAPLIAQRCEARADLFTTLCFALTMTLLWRYREGRATRLWLLPPLFFAWTNLHFGVAAGVAAICGYILCELADLPFAARRAAAWSRLRRAAGWLTLSTAATLANPWGPNVFGAIFQLSGAGAQKPGLQLSGAIIGEYAPMPWSGPVLRAACNLRDPDGAFYWMSAACLALSALLLLRRRIGAPVLLLAAVYAASAHLRYVALFAIVVVVAGSEAASDRGAEAPTAERRALRWAPTAAAILLIALVCARSADLASGRLYAEHARLEGFGAGLSQAMPERAAAFIERERLPGNVFHSGYVGGFLALRLGPVRRVFSDGRNVNALRSVEQERLLTTPPDTPVWRQASELWNIQVVLLPLERHTGLGEFNLRAWLSSNDWQPVYADENSLVLLRRREANRPWLERLRAGLPVAPTPSSDRLTLYNRLCDVAGADFLLERDAEALANLEEALRLYPQAGEAHLQKALLLSAEQRPEAATAELQAALRRRPSAALWRALGDVRMSSRDYSGAAEAYREAARVESLPFGDLLKQGRAEQQAGRAEQALRTLARADAAQPIDVHFASPSWRLQAASLHRAKARAYYDLHQTPQAIAEQKLALEAAPDAPQLWDGMASLLQSIGDAKGAKAASDEALRLYGGRRPEDNTPPSVR